MAKGVIKLIKKRDTLLNNIVPPLPNPNFEPRIELTSDREAVIEGCDGILEYDDTKAVINCKNIIFSFEGFSLNLKALSTETIIVSGRITNLNISSR